ncbi:hypothetical protein NDU88_010077 [Pleurodeles waltl]|uniref:Uncharacterized protein n=1 Tax=Pleurodeles waltl TaxID=8319 RepID=A0AAV7QZ93_PLEWA|nr:hypothetical protein NDU88_010077 [Pleurodeles waltl]
MSFAKGCKGLTKQAQNLTDEAVAQGEQVAKDCMEQGKAAGQEAIDKGCKAAKESGEHVAGQVKDQFAGMKKK